uniref:Uncharacterized protein n=1 Tax=Arion vulgaris TaxID=1028688 RepID=A0A0B7ADH8_9EUPU
MMTIPSLMVTLVLLLGLQEVKTLDIQACLNELTGNTQNGMGVCPAMTIYIKCIIRGTEMYKSPEIDKQLVNQIKKRVDIALRQSGASCDIDIMTIVQQLREEYQTGLTNKPKGLEDDKRIYQDHSELTITTQKPSRYQKAKTAEDCLNTFTSDDQDDGISCSMFTSYMKCLFRVTKNYKMKNINYDELDKKMNNILKPYGIHCDIDTRELVDEVRQEMKDGKDSAFIARPFQLIALLAFTVLSMYLSYY